MVWPIFAIALAGMLAAPAGAIAYGFRRPVREINGPDLRLTAIVVRDYRGARSLWFSFYHGFWRVLMQDVFGPGGVMDRIRRRDRARGKPKWNRRVISQLGLSPFEVRQVLSLYDGLEPELGAFHATACCVEVVRNFKARDRRLKAIKDDRESPEDDSESGP